MTSFSKDEEIFSIQINVIDSVTRSPNKKYDPLQTKFLNTKIEKIPLIQIFGKTKQKKNEVVLIHGAFPTIFIDCPVDDDYLTEYKEAVYEFIRKLPGGYVYDMDVVTRTAIYGYNQPSRFLQILLLSPREQKQISYELTNFVWNGQAIHVYEGHIPFFMHFFRLYNLTGCIMLEFKQSFREESTTTKYPSEIHVDVNDIITIPTNSHSQILSHLGPFWSQQRKIRERLEPESQAAITCPARRDLIFTQRPPSVPSQTQSSNPPSSVEELEHLLEYLEKYDPDETIEDIERENEKSQIEVNSILENIPVYHTPATFVPGRIEGSLKPTLSQDHPIEVTSFATQLITQESIGIFQHEKTSDEIKMKPIVLSQSITETEKPQSNSQQTNQQPSQLHPTDLLTLLFIEVGCATREKLCPDPRYDPVKCVSYCIVENQEILDHGIFYFGQPFQCGFKAHFYPTENSMFEALTEYILKIDPDILVGYNIERESFGYLVERGNNIGIKNWHNMISRTKEPILSFDECKKITGRILINFWRIVRHKENLRTYDLTNVANEILGAPFPSITDEHLSIFASIAPHRFVHHIHSKMMTIVSLVNKMTIIEQFTELSLVIGLDFCSVISRGSQFQTESLLSRVSWRMGYLLNTPTRRDIASQKAPMSLPLVMEPSSGYYKDPVMVLDFQSLYPSCIIAYNLDFSTVVGRTELATSGGQLGFMSYYKLKRSKLERLVDENKIINTPNDVLYVTKEVRTGVLPTLLTQILDLRAYVKQTLKKETNEKMKRILDARQMALKGFAACTYGYTAAHFSGRMPCVEIADSIVECSRHMLEFVIDHIEKDYPELTVLYGDTDSLFIKMPAASKEECFEFGQKLCDEITAFFPSPVKIKLEKIFSGCFLVNKKRYCGWMFESATQEKPTMLVKGLEMKRRDSCLLVKNVMTDVIEAIFRTGSIEKARSVFDYHFNRIIYGRVILKEFLFAREVRLGTYKSDVEPPGAIVAKRAMEKDPRAAPLYGERYPFVVVSSTPNSKLIDRVVSPLEFVEGPTQFRIGTRYYIDRQIIPALGRVLETMGIDVNEWVLNKSRDLFKLPIYIFDTSRTRKNSVTAMERFCKSVQCPLCNKRTLATTPVCSECLSAVGRNESLFELIQRIKSTEKIVTECNRKCSKCLGIMGATNKICLCSSCDTYWKCKLAESQNEALNSYRDVLEKMISDTTYF
ncbi:DNA polymerase activity protein [Tritrichomonas musculus]|uniref:DNA polymerase n=1 Tax=Tritrichomonas musculus TaxID=1915356 RepID=A0ABR2JJU1_9EUKA